MVLALKGSASSRALAYALTHDFNFRDPASHTRYHVGQGVAGTVVALPSGRTGDPSGPNGAQSRPGCSSTTAAAPTSEDHLRIQQQPQRLFGTEQHASPPCQAVAFPGLPC